MTVPAHRVPSSVMTPSITAALDPLTEIFSPIQSDLEAFERLLERSLVSDADLITEINRHLLARRGKRLRPAIVFLAARLCDVGRGTAAAPFSLRAGYAALAIELIHTATLLHDDVVDESPTRRGQATVNAKWKNLIAVLMGDYYFSKAFTLLVKAETEGLMGAVSTATERVSVGQLLEIQESRNFGVTEAAYFRIIQEKTASLFGAAAEAGALVAGAPLAAQLALREYGEKLGNAFQIADDGLDLVGKVEKTGKDLGTDLREGKVTLPLIFALAQAADGNRERIVQLLENGMVDGDFSEVVSFIRTQGGLEYASRKARTFGSEAQALLASFPDSAYRQALSLLARFAVERER